MCYTKFHAIEKDVYYRLWSLTSNGVIQKDPNNLAIVPCSGGFSDADITVIQAQPVGSNLFYLVFNGLINGEPDLYITAKEEGQGITLTDSPSDYAKFEPIYFWSYTLFRSKSRSTLDSGMYLGSNENALATLIQVDEDHSPREYYPNPQALFIINKVKSPTTQPEC